MVFDWKASNQRSKLESEEDVTGWQNKLDEQRDFLGKLIVIRDTLLPFPDTFPALQKENNLAIDIMLQRVKICKEQLGFAKQRYKMYHEI